MPQRMFLAIGLLFVVVAHSAQAQEAEPSAGYESGRGFFIAGEGFELRTGLRLMTRLEYLAPEADDAEIALMIRRARLRFGGSALDSRLRYQLQMGLDRGDVTLLDFYGDWAFIPSELQLRVGQFKVPISRAYLSSSFANQFCERSITNKMIGAARDIGLVLYRKPTDDLGLEWRIGLFNGTGSRPQFFGDVVVEGDVGEIVSGGRSHVPDHFNPLLIARLGWVFGGMRAYRDAALDRGPLEALVAVTGAYDFDTDNDDASRARATLDLGLRVAGLAVYAAGYYSRVMLEGSDAVEAWGADVQLGYLFGDLVEPAFRFSLIDADSTSQEITLGLSMYFFGHTLKWQTDASLLRNELEAADTFGDDYRLRTHLVFTL